MGDTLSAIGALIGIACIMIIVGIYIVLPLIEWVLGDWFK